MKERYYVICGNKAEYDEYVRKNFKENGQREYIYLYDVLGLKGIANPSGVFVGTWYERPDIPDIISLLYMSCTETEKKYAITKVHQIYRNKTIRSI